MKLTYYGTAAAEGWPGLFCRCFWCQEAKRRGGNNIRTRSQASIDDKLLIDFPPDTYLHMLYYGLDLPNYRHCIITHAHEDHLYERDLATRIHGYADDVLPGPLTLYGPDSVIDALNALPEWAKDHERLGWEELHEYQPLMIEDYTITPLIAAHGQYGTHPRIKCYIYDIKKDEVRLLYGNDTAYFPERTWDYIRGRYYHLVSLDCTMLNRTSKNHMGIQDVLRVQDRLFKIGCADERTKWVITHFSHHGGILHEELVRQMSEYHIYVAYDGFTIETEN